MVFDASYAIMGAGEASSNYTLDASQAYAVLNSSFNKNGDSDNGYELRLVSENVSKVESFKLDVCV
jgi:hypothetical protein